jgi:hypothetical protein
MSFCLSVCLFVSREKKDYFRQKESEARKAGKAAATAADASVILVCLSVQLLVYLFVCLSVCTFDDL